MNILLVIDSLGPGGAQRQLVELAVGLKRRGHGVDIFVYYPALDFFKSRILSNGIGLHEVEKRGKYSAGVLWELCSVLKNKAFDITLSFLSTPNFYAEASKLLGYCPKLLVSERSSHKGDKSRVRAHIQRKLHGVADHVVVNSEDHKRWLESNYSCLREKVTCIYNGIALDNFPFVPGVLGKARPLRLIAIGRIGPEKNPAVLIKALNLFFHKYGWLPTVSWIGGEDMSNTGCAYRADVDLLLGGLPHVKKVWNWLGVKIDVASYIQQCDALVLPSFYEGLPNVVCEALASGRPVLASEVCDNGILVEEGARGFLFDPNDAESLCDALKRMSDCSIDKRREISRNCRNYAESNLDISVMISKYEKLFESTVAL